MALNRMPLGGFSCESTPAAEGSPRRTPCRARRCWKATDAIDRDCHVTGRSPRPTELRELPAFAEDAVILVSTRTWRAHADATPFVSFGAEDGWLLLAGVFPLIVIVGVHLWWTWLTRPGIENQ